MIKTTGLPGEKPLTRQGKPGIFKNETGWRVLVEKGTLCEIAGFTGRRDHPSAVWAFHGNALLADADILLFCDRLFLYYSIL